MNIHYSTTGQRVGQSDFSRWIPAFKSESRMPQIHGYKQDQKQQAPDENIHSCGLLGFLLFEPGAWLDTPVEENQFC
jgi:hypothetical protein